MYASSFNMLHNAGNKNPFPVANGVYLDFYTVEIFVNKHRMLTIHLQSQCKVADQLRFVVHDFHGPPPQNIARAH